MVQDVRKLAIYLYVNKITIEANNISNLEIYQAITSIR